MVQRLVQNFHPEKIILFGSHARGTAGPDSDVDLLVVMNTKGPKRKYQIEMYRLLAGMGYAKDLMIATPKEIERYQDIPGSIIRPALQEGIIVYDQQSPS